MTEQHPPVPPAPQQQPAGFQPPFSGSQPPFSGSQPPQYSQAPQYGQPAPYIQQPYQQPYGQQPQYAPCPPQQYAPQWGQPVPSKPKSSGFRLAAGIVEIVLGLALLLATPAGFYGKTIVGFLLLIAALGNITAGIVLLAMQRRKTRAAPVTSISFAGFALVPAFMTIPLVGIVTFFLIFLLAIPVLVIMGLGLSREMKETASPSYQGS